MDKVNIILQNDVYKEHLHKIEELEVDRIYCRHDMTHFLDVARIATILAYENDIIIDRDVIYAAAILHDIGRDEQYTNGIPHEEASALIAPEILRAAGYGELQINMIVEAISEHGNEESLSRNDLTGIIYRADKLSRKCFACKVTDSCHKAHYKRNMIIKY